MKKPYDFRVMTGKRCAICNRVLKANVVARKTDRMGLTCYRCYVKLQIAGGHIMRQPKPLSQAV